MNWQLENIFFKMAAPNRLAEYPCPAPPHQESKVVLDAHPAEPFVKKLRPLTHRPIARNWTAGCAIHLTAPHCYKNTRITPN